MKNPCPIIGCCVLIGLIATYGVFSSDTYPYDVTDLSCHIYSTEKFNCYHNSTDPVGIKCNDFHDPHKGDSDKWWVVMSYYTVYNHPTLNSYQGELCYTQTCVDQWFDQYPENSNITCWDSGYGYATLTDHYVWYPQYSTGYRWAVYGSLFFLMMLVICCHLFIVNRQEKHPDPYHDGGFPVTAGVSTTYYVTIPETDQ